MIRYFFVARCAVLARCGLRVRLPTIMHAALPLVALVRLGFGGAPTPVRPLADPEAFRALVQGTQTSGRAAVVQFSSTRCKAFTRTRTLTLTRPLTLSS